MRVLLKFLVTAVLCLQGAHASEVESIQENIRQMGFDKYYFELRRINNKDRVKIAVLDYGFDGFQGEKGYTISKYTELKINPSDQSASSGSKNTHGLAMAQILTQYMTKDYAYWSLAPKIYLYKSNGYSNFQWAINDAIKNGVDIILHSIVIEYGSNYDGEGFYNSLVNRATDAGIIWVNAAGNFGLTTYNTTAKTDEDGWVQMEDTEENALPVSCELPKDSKIRKAMRGKCNIRIVLAWDDFKNQPDIGSTKDFDLYLFGEDKKLRKHSGLTQINAKNKNRGASGYTLYPREIIQTEISEGTSYIRVKSKNKDPIVSQKIRITADGEYISFPIRDGEESLLNPADNPSVITVGEDSERSSVSKSLNKPELLAPSLVKGDDGRWYMGSSNAAAVVAAGIGLMKSLNPGLDRDGILNSISKNISGSKNINPILLAISTIPKELDAGFVQSNDSSTPKKLHEPVMTERRSRPKFPNHFAIPLKVLNYGPPPRVGCFPLADIKRVEACTVANFIIKSHSLLVETTSGLKIATSFDPIKLIPGDERQDIRDVIAILPVERNPFRRIPRHIPLPPGAIEIFKVPIDEAICKLPDWDFLMTELEVSRRRVFEANSIGAYNNYIPDSCSADTLVSARYGLSDWGMYPILQQSPYIAPVGPAPIENPHGYGYRGEPGKQKSFQMPDPEEIE